jgi:hypothetical protein
MFFKAKIDETISTLDELMLHCLPNGSEFRPVCTE